MRGQNRKNIILLFLLMFVFSSLLIAAGKKTKQWQSYRGAPPVIPHEIESLGRRKCLSCHFQGLDLGLKGGKAYKTPHPERSNCLQCHLPQKKVELFKKNKFVPLEPVTEQPDKK